MTQRRSILHPNFIIGLISYLLLLIGVFVGAQPSEAGYSLIIAAVLLGGLHWVRSMVDVWTDSDLKNDESIHYFWFALVIMIPPLAGMMYYMIHEKRISL